MLRTFTYLFKWMQLALENELWVAGLWVARCDTTYWNRLRVSSKKCCLQSEYIIKSYLQVAYFVANRSHIQDWNLRRFTPYCLFCRLLDLIHNFLTELVPRRSEARQDSTRLDTIFQSSNTKNSINVLVVRRIISFMLILCYLPIGESVNPPFCYFGSTAHALWFKISMSTHSFHY